MRQTAAPIVIPAADPSWRVGIIHSSYYADDVSKLVSGATEALIKAGLSADNITLHEAPGCFEIPLLGSVLVAEKKVDALIALGIIVEGETHHADLIAREVTRGIMDVQLDHQIPFAYEILYVDKLSQAKVRSAGIHNKGGEAARTVLHCLAEIGKLRS